MEASNTPTIRSCRHQLSPIARDRKPRSTGPADFRVQPNRLTNERTLLVSSPAFVFERIDLPPNSAWCLGADRETWLLVLSGGARTGSFDVTIGDAVFVQSDRVNIHAGTIGMGGVHGRRPSSATCCSASNSRGAMDAGRPQEVQVPISLTRSKDGPNERTSGNN